MIIHEEPNVRTVHYSKNQDELEKFCTPALQLLWWTSCCDTTPGNDPVKRVSPGNSIHTALKAGIEINHDYTQINSEQGCPVQIEDGFLFGVSTHGFLCSNRNQPAAINSQVLCIQHHRPTGVFVATVCIEPPKIEPPWLNWQQHDAITNGR